MSISRDDVTRTAKLAHLMLTESETESMVQDLGRILEYVESLADETGEGPFSAAADPSPGTPMREDTVVAGLDAGDALAQAPSVSENAFRVPPMLEGS